MRGGPSGIVGLVVAAVGIFLLLWLLGIIEDGLDLLRWQRDVRRAARREPLGHAGGPLPARP